MNRSLALLISPLFPLRTRWSVLVAMLVVGAVLPLQGDPGELFQKRRQVIVAKFDVNKDGRLDATEREAARAAKKEEALKGGGRNPMFQMPPEIVEMYDKDQDGQLNDQESAAANEGIRIKWGEAQKEYDTNGDGNLDDTEREKLGEAIAAGKVKGLPRMFGGMMRRPAGGGRGGMFGGAGAGESPLTKYDTDMDGRLSDVELENARKANGGTSPTR